MSENTKENQNNHLVPLSCPVCDSNIVMISVENSWSIGSIKRLYPVISVGCRSCLLKVTCDLPGPETGRSIIEYKDIVHRWNFNGEKRGRVPCGTEDEFREEFFSAIEGALKLVRSDDEFKPIHIKHLYKAINRTTPDEWKDIGAKKEIANLPKRCSFTARYGDDSKSKFVHCIRFHDQIFEFPYAVGDDGFDRDISKKMLIHDLKGGFEEKFLALFAGATIEVLDNMHFKSYPSDFVSTFTIEGRD